MEAFASPLQGVALPGTFALQPGDFRPCSLKQMANPVCAFSSVLGARCPALGVDPVPGPGFQVPGIRDLEPGTRRLSSKNLHTGLAR
jgi:hypothetical protein